MVKRLLIILLTAGAVLAADDKTSEVVNSCDREVVKKVNAGGIKSIRFYQLPNYYWHAWRCQKISGEKNIIKQNERRQIDQDFNQSYRLEGCSSTITYVAVVAVIYFFSAKALKK